MNKRKQINLLESELEFARSDYQHTHDTLWNIFNLLCNEFNMHLTMRAKSLLEPEDHEPGSIEYLVEQNTALQNLIRLVVKEWDERGDGGCTKTIQDQLRKAVFVPPLDESGAITTDGDD